ncbi:hypothetical protein Clacol_007989 [Clathrus columnatus]|uniref:Uncharacterized protein n=1 Tax=Clathrus columnatus TaxID=1419009 RepID=A0AAV5AKX1_9AGAM|nr:hypothetical protein Clacol_007989 [Clathrus columnatus]
MAKHDPNTIRMVEGILLLANKYQIDHLRERLERDWPSKLIDWDVNELEIKANKEHKQGISLPDPCEAIRLARRCGTPSILPAAFYRLSRIRGISNRHMPVSLQQIMLDPNARSVVPTTDFSLLSAQDLYCLVVGRDVILHIFERYLGDTLDEMTKPENKHSTSNPDKCWKSLLKFQSKLRQEVFQNFNDPLFIMNGRDDYSSSECWVCQHVFMDLLKPKREFIWENLPSLFMLDTK